MRNCGAVVADLAEDLVPRKRLNSFKGRPAACSRRTSRLKRSGRMLHFGAKKLLIDLQWGSGCGAVLPDGLDQCLF